MLHNTVFVIGKWEPIHENLPPFFDLMLLPLPDVTNYDDTGFILTYKGVVADYGTGTYADFLLPPQPVSKFDAALSVYTRKQYNRLLDFAFTVQGRYFSFWTPTMAEVFLPVGYMPAHFPEVAGLDMVGGTTADTECVMYVLNWGQAKAWQNSKKLIHIYYDGYKYCHWNRVSKVESTVDFRILKVTFDYPIPHILINRIDIITDIIYAHQSADELQMESLTSTHFECVFSLVEDTFNYYDPWTEMPPIYPQPDEEEETP